MTETLSIPLNKLNVWDGNVRKTGAGDGIEELAASIDAHGLLQALIVRSAKGGKYAVVAGQRRLKALKLLASQKRLAANTPVRCELVSDEVDAGELSLAENVVRVAMHPADQFEAFRDLVDRGLDVAAVACRFGITETVVQKRLKLGRLSPVILEAYRAGDIGLEESQAFAISDDHEAQERVFADLTDWSRNPSTIRRSLTEGEISADDKRVQFVGLETYEQAGGAVRRDLFDTEDTGTILDVALLDRLVSDKLDSVADSVRAEGWAWVETCSDFDRSLLADYRRAFPERVELTDDQESQREALAAEYDQLADSPEADDNDPVTIERLSVIEQTLDELDAAQQSWSAETLAVAGAIVTVTYGGAAGVERGLIRRGDDPAVIRDDAEAKPREPAGISAALVEDLTAQKTAALRVALAGRPDVALAAVVHAMTLQALYPYSIDQSCLQISVRGRYPERLIAEPDTMKALHVDADAELRWTSSLPEAAGELWPWCLAQSQDTLLALLAFVAGRAVNAVQSKTDRPDNPRFVHADALASSLALDMNAWFTPDAANYFGRISSAQIIAALCEAKGVSPAPSWTKMKKADLAAFAARELAGTGWLPMALRIRDAEIVPAEAAA